MSIQQFMNNNEFAKSIISQYVGCDHLKNIFTNGALKQLIWIVMQYAGYNSSPLSYNKIKSKYFNITETVYRMSNFNDTDGYYQEYYTCKNILYSKLGHYHYKQYVYNPYNSHITMISNDDMPPSIITQINYFN